MCSAASSEGDDARRPSRAPGAFAQIAATFRPRRRRLESWRHGARANRPLARVPAALREPVPGLLLPAPPLAAAPHLPPRRGRDDLARRRPRLRRPGPDRARGGGRPALDPDRVLAAPARLPLGARPSARQPPSLHHAWRPPRPSERPPAPRDAAGRERAARLRLLRRVHARLRHPGRVPRLRGLHPRLPGLRLHALPRAPPPPADQARQAPARAAHAPPLPGPPLRVRRLLPALGRRVRHPAAQAARLKRDPRDPATVAGRPSAAFAARAGRTLERAPEAQLVHVLGVGEVLAAAPTAVAREAVALVEAPGALVAGQHPEHGLAVAALAHGGQRRLDQRAARSRAPAAGGDVEGGDLSDVGRLIGAARGGKAVAPLPLALRKAERGEPLAVDQARVGDLPGVNVNLGDRVGILQGRPSHSHITFVHAYTLTLTVQTASGGLVL